MKTILRAFTISLLCSFAALSANAAPNIKVNSISVAAGTAGMATTPVAYGATNYAVFGFQLNGSGAPASGTVTSLTVAQNGTSLSNFSTYFTTAYLYSMGASNTFSIGSATLLSTQTSGAATNITFSGLSIAMSSTTNSPYLFVVLSDNLGNTTTNTFQLAVSAYTYTVTSGTTPNLTQGAPSHTGPSYTFGNLTLGTATTTGLASALTTNQTQAGVLGFSISSSGIAGTISGVTLSAAISPASTVGNFFGGFTIYENSTNTLSGASLLGTASVSSLSGTSFTISGLSQALASGATDYFFIKANYTQPSTGSYTFQLSATGVTFSSPSVTVTNGGPISGSTYTFIAPPAFSFTTPNYFDVGSTASLSLTATGGPMAALGYGTGVALTATGLNAPMGMAFDASGNLYVADYGAGTILKYTGGTGTATTFISGLTQPTNVTFDLSGNVYVATNAGYVYKYNAAGGSQTTLITGGGSPYSAYGLAVDASGNVYITDPQNFQVFKYTASAGTSANLIPYTSFYPSNPYVKQPVGVGVDAAGNLYIMGNSNGTIASYTAAGNFSTSLVTGISTNNSTGFLSGFFMDSGGNFYVADPGTGTVYAYNSAGTAVATISGLTNPRGVVTDSQGNMYVSDYTNNTLTKYTINSGYTLNFASGTNSLPPGIGFNSSTGTFSGTPTKIFSGTYTVTGINGGGTYTSSNFTINCGNPPAISYVNPGTYAENAAVSLSPANSGSASTNWSVSPSLPAGLAINPTTGVISGTTSSSVASAATSYTVSATNSYGSGTCNVLISIYGAPVISYPQPSYSLTVNVAVSPTINIANSGGGVIAHSYDLPTTVIGPTSPIPPAAPWGVTTDPSGNIWLADASYVREISPSGTETDYNWSYVGPAGIVSDASGNIYVLTLNDIIYKYTASTGIFSIFANQPAGTIGAYGLAIDPMGSYLYFTDSQSAQIYRCPISSAVSTAYIQTGSTGLSYPEGIQVDAAGNIYTADYATGKVLEYNAAGAFLQTPITGLSQPNALYIDKYGYIYVGDSSLLRKYASDGSAVWSTFYSVVQTRGITADALGNLFVVDLYNHSLFKYPPVNYTLTGGLLPVGISFSAVTGTFSGTPTAAFSATTFNIAAYGMGSTAASTSVTLSCAYAYDWIGTTSSDWNITGNWKSLTVPTTANTANIGVNYAFTNQPTVGLSGATTVNVGGILIGNSGGQAATLTVNGGYTLGVTGNITKQSDAKSLQSYATGANLAGLGTITAANVAVIGSTVLSSIYTETLSSSVASLKLSGTVKLTSGFSTYAQNATFNVTGGVTQATTALTSTNAAGATSTFGVVPAGIATLQLAAPAALSGLSSAGVNVVNFNNTGATIEYSGGAQTFYTDATVTNLSTTIKYQNVKFSGTGIKSPPAVGGNLYIGSNFTNTMVNDAANYPLLTGTPVYFNGSGAQNIYAGSGSGTVLGNVSFNGLGASTIQSGSLYVNDAGTLTMAGTATLNANGNLTLIGDAGGNAAVAQITSGTPISGTVNVQRYITAERGYRLLSSPVYAGTVSGNNVYSINYLTGSLYVTGSGGTSGLFNAAGNATLYLYNEGFVPQYSSFYNSNFIGISSLSGGTGATPSYTVNTNGAGLTGAYSIPVGNGYYCFYRGALSTETVAQLTNPAYGSVKPAALTASGTLTQGQVVFKDWYTPGSSYLGAASQHFNLIGNPYASAIDLSKVQTGSTATGIYATAYNGVANTGITNFIYELNPTTGNYGVYTVGSALPPTNGASQYIASGEGFFVQAYGANASQFIFNESAKANAAQANIQGLMTSRLSYNTALDAAAIQNSLLRLTLAKDSVQNEDVLIAFNNTAKTTYVINEDAPHKSGGGIIGFSSTSADSVLMAINVMPPAASQAIPLNVYASNNGLYTISLSQLVPLPGLYDIWLKDAFVHDSLDIKHNAVYSFNIDNAVAASYGTNRFRLVIRQNPALMVHLLSFAAQKLADGDNISWKTENEVNYTHFAVQRSTNGGKSYATLDSVTSASLGAYNYLDAKPAEGINNYRLRMTDINGSISYSDVVAIMYSNTSNSITINRIMVYPNPTANQVNLAIDNPNGANTLVTPSYQIQVTNNVGVIITNTTSSKPTWTKDVSGLVPGVYFVTVINTSNNTLVGKSTFVKL